MNLNLNQYICPICGEENRCAMTLPQSTGSTPKPCWCVTATFSPELLEKVPEESRNNACICLNCFLNFTKI